MAEPRCQQLFFDPEEHPDDTLKAFEDFTQTFELRYDAQYPDPPKVSIDAAIERWKFANPSSDTSQPKPSLEEYDKIRDEWRSGDKVSKLLGMFSSNRLFTDWKIAQSNNDVRKACKWELFIETMKEFYKPTANDTLKNYHFRSLSQLETETFPGFCNRVQKESKHCNFKCSSEECTAEETAIRDQIIIGTRDNSIREESLKKSWDLKTLRIEGMRMESAARSGAEIAGESSVNKIGKYSFQNIKKRNENVVKSKKTPISCFNCGNEITGPIRKHKEICPAKGVKCKKCSRTGHFAKVCKSEKNLRQISTDSQLTTDEDTSQDEDAYIINVFRTKSSTQTVKPKLTSQMGNKKDFRIQVIVNNSLDYVVADTGAHISVCGTSQAKKWNLLHKMVPSKKKIKPYNSDTIPVHGEAQCAVSFGSSSVPVVWHIISGSCEPILSGNAALQLGIIQFNPQPDTFQPVLLIESECKNELKSKLQKCLARYPENFSGLGKLRNHQAKFHVDESVKPVNVPPRSIPYHLQERAQRTIDEMIKQDVIEEQPSNEPAPWVSNAVLTPKPDGSIRMTLDARNVNKAIHATNQPIPRHEDIKAKLAGCKVFSKMDFKSAFWQIELEEQSRKLTVFHANDKLYRYKRLTMGMKPSQGELTQALQPIFANISDAHLIHDDLIVATKTDEEHVEVIDKVMKAIAKANVTLNPPKCCFGRKEVSFWGMIYGANGIRPDSEKVEALDYISAPKNKEELVSFLCMMQSNADFIPNFAHKSAILRDLTKSRVHFKWSSAHQECFENLIANFKEDVLRRYFDMSKKKIVFIDAHRTGLGATLAQGENVRNAKPVAFASRTTNKAEATGYAQLDLEAMGLDFGCRRFRQYSVGSPDAVTIVTDNKPLCSIFNGRRKGSIRTERIKMRHQDIRFQVVFQKGKLNQADFLSRRGKPLQRIPKHE